PFLTSAPGPNGETAELVLANLRVQFIQDHPDYGELPWLELAVDAPLGFELGYDPVAGQLTPTITPPEPGAIDARVVSNPLRASEPAVEALFPNLFPAFVEGVGASFAAFPLPAFLGLGIDVLDVARQGNHFVLYANL